MPAGSLRQLSVHQVQPAEVVFRDWDGPKAFRISGGQRAVPAEDRERPGWAREGCLTQGKVQFRVSVVEVEARYLENENFRMLFAIFPTF